jgi:hypothetical protein
MKDKRVKLVYTQHLPHWQYCRCLGLTYVLTTSTASCLIGTIVTLTPTLSSLARSCFTPLPVASK